MLVGQCLVNKHNVPCINDQTTTNNHSFHDRPRPCFATIKMNNNVPVIELLVTFWIFKSK